MRAYGGGRIADLRPAPRRAAPRRSELGTRHLQASAPIYIDPARTGPVDTHAVLLAGAAASQSRTPSRTSLRPQTRFGNLHRRALAVALSVVVALAGRKHQGICRCRRDRCKKLLAAGRATQDPMNNLLSRTQNKRQLTVVNTHLDSRRAPTKQRQFTQVTCRPVAQWPGVLTRCAQIASELSMRNGDCLA
jgi:hypothetical protein